MSRATYRWGREAAVWLRRWLPVVLWVAGGIALCALCLGPEEALARVGGGDSFGGGGGGGGYGGGSGGDDALLIWILIEIARFLIILTIEYPAIGIPLDILFIVVVILIIRHRLKRRGTGPRGAPARRPPSRRARQDPRARAQVVNQALQRLRGEDPNFSRPLLLDFVQLLYVRAHEHRGSGKLEHLAPYLDPQVRRELAALPGDGPLRGVDRIVIGASRILEVGGWTAPNRGLVVEFEANYRELRGEGDAPTERTLYVVERWAFKRKAGVLSKGPDAITDLRCPSCGAAVELKPDGTCPYCDNVVDKGHFHWTVARIQVQLRRPRSRAELHLGGGAEVGTDLPTVVDPGLNAQLRALTARDPAFDQAAFKGRVHHVFMALQKAWTEGTWDEARAYETDHLFQSHRFWMEQYAAEGLRNVLDRIQIQKIQLVKVEQDAYFDAATVRVHASMIDFVQDGQGKVVSGDKRKPRVFTEYWTFIRRAGVASRPGEKADQCPSCGAEVHVSQAGVCDYCGTKVVSGEFGWVLSTIEQDEVYGG